jgi:putative endonuclease
MREFGEQMEIIALQYLQKQGLRLLERNFQCYSGEIDLIMRDRVQVIFVEVRHRANTSHGSALESITPAKIKKIVKAATLYLQRKKWLYTVSSRFDVITFDGPADTPAINWIRNAFYP